MINQFQVIRTSALAVACVVPMMSAHSIAMNAGYAQPADEGGTDVQPLLDWGDPKPRATTTPKPNTERPERREPTVSFGVFSEPIQLTTLIEYVGSSLRINIIVKGNPTGEVTFHAPIEVPKSQLIDLLDAMLEQYSFTVSHEPNGDFWIVQPMADVRPTMGSDRASTKIIATPNIVPSLLVQSLNASLGTTVGGGGANRGGPIQAIDELGVLIINAPPRDIQRVEALVNQLIQIDEDQTFIRFELNHVAAPAARERAIGLVGGGGSSNGGRAPNPNNPGGNNLGGGGASLSSMTDRITIDPQGNAIIFKGTDAEIARVQEVLDVIDVPNTLEPKNYFAGASAEQIADIAKSHGLGEVISISDEVQNPFGGGNFRNQNANGFQTGTSNSNSGGPVMVVDTTRGNIVYYGTPAQQQQLSDLLEELGTEDERIIVKEYVLHHSDAEEVADLMTSIITGEQRTGDSDFLPGSTGRRRGEAEFVRNFGNAFSGGSDVNASFDPDVVSVTADISNNQVLIQAPIKQQDDLEKLLNRLDRRKSQVYLQAMIVSISDTENFNLAFESQLNAGQFGLVTGNTLSSAATNSGFGDLRNVATGLAGLTSAVVMTDQIPIIINASQTNSDVKILSTPQLLVNNNEESEIVALSEQPYQEINLGAGGDNTSTFGGFEEAGTTLRVTPSISDGGFLRLEYFVELSNFTAASGTDGSPPPRDRNTVNGTATIPSDATIVIGGITVDNVRDTVIKVPLLGDIPLVGELFKNTTKVSTKSKLYVFLTPRIMTDPNFMDLKLLSEGPYAEMELDPEVPDLEPVVINASAPVSIDTEENFDRPSSVLPELPESSSGAPALEPVLVDPVGSTD